ncbi:hypothetical protein UlMin_034128 [Ulmus minor]
MGKPTSCFKIITCGSDSADKDDLDVTESKASGDKRGWSFRKRSVRHRVLSNTVITETPTSASKEAPESATRNFETSADASVPEKPVAEKVSVIHYDVEKPPLATSVDPKVPDVVVVAENESENENENETKLDESNVVVIQSAIRVSLAQKERLKLKNVIKLQAAVRGHLVRRHAVGTLRCVQAIVKMQALVRARRARLSLGGSNQDEKFQEQANLETKSSGTYISIEKLLSNSFARQVLESTPKTKPIHVKCDSSKPGSAWNWLERWMSVSTVEVPESKKEVVVTEQDGEKEEKLESPTETRMQSEETSESEDKGEVLVTEQDEGEKEEKLESPIETRIQSEVSEDNLITYEADKFVFQASHSTTSSIRETLEQPQLENNSTSDAKETQVFQPNQCESDAALYEISETEAEQPKRSMKRIATEQLDTENKKYVYGSMKASNPMFIAAHSKVEELSSSVNSGRSVSSSCLDDGVESHKETISSGAHPVIRTNEISPVESPVFRVLRFQVGGSECSTELSISSTLDSPDRSDIATLEYEPEAKVSEEVNGDAKVSEGVKCDAKVSEEGKFNAQVLEEGKFVAQVSEERKLDTQVSEEENYIYNSIENQDLEAKDDSTIPEPSLSDSVPDHIEKLNVVNGESATSVVFKESPVEELKLDKSESEIQREKHFEIGVHVYDSPEASPRSHVTVPESQGTPASQVSMKAGRTKSDKSGSDRKRGSLPVAKKSPSSASHNSGSRSSVEKLAKDQKSGKRRASFGSPKPDQSDQEPRESSSNSSVPRFMQATESARAKLNATSSPRSSPDMQDRDVYVKKRHSLPGANGRQGSPRIQKSTSQAQQGTKEKKWQR